MMEIQSVWIFANALGAAEILESQNSQSQKKKNKKTKLNHGNK